MSYNTIQYQMYTIQRSSNRQPNLQIFKSVSLSRRSLKIKLPKASMLSKFFSKSPTNSQQYELSNDRSESTRSGQILRINKSISLKSMQCSSLAKKLKKADEEQKNKIENQSKQKLDSQSLSKDESRTRSQITVLDEYGLIEGPLVKNVPSPKVPKQIKRHSGNKKTIFPLKASHKKVEINQNQQRVKSKGFTPLQYTFGIQGVGFHNINHK